MAGAAIHGVCQGQRISRLAHARGRECALVVKYSKLPPAPPKAGAEVPRQVGDYEQQIGQRVQD